MRSVFAFRHRVLLCFAQKDAALLEYLEDNSRQASASEKELSRMQESDKSQVSKPTLSAKTQASPTKKILFHPPLPIL
jgi:hypothetical protein